jgi:hypothetical protein
MRNENVPTPSSPEGPPLAPSDLPDAAPQAIAWLRALKVIGCDPRGRTFVVVSRRQTPRG